MNRGYDHEVNGRWSSGHVLSAWYSGEQFDKSDVLVTWCSQPRKHAYDAVHLPSPGVSETGERYVWLRRADSSTLVTPGDKSDIFEPMIVNQLEGVFFQTGGVQVFQKLTEREANNHITRYWQERGQA